MRCHIHFLRAVVALLTVTVSALPLHAWAGSAPEPDLPAIGRDGQAFGESLLDVLRSAPTTVEGGVISAPGTGEPMQINVGDLFPGTSASNTAPASYYFPDGNVPVVGDMEALHASSDDMNRVGSDAKGTLWNDAHSATPSISGAAYKVLLDATDQPKPDLRNDPVLSTARNTYQNIDLHAAGFGDCSAVTTTQPATIATHIPDYEQCQRIVDRSAVCQVSHDLSTDQWTPQSCIEAAQGLSDGFASGEATCLDNPDDGTGCATINGVQVCEASLGPSPIAGIPALCRQVRVQAQYDFFKGEMECWTDAQGDTQCPEVTSAPPDTCQALRDNPQCVFVRSECTEDAEGASGTCYVSEDTYDCGTNVTVPTLEKRTEYQCEGTIRCMGDECLDVTKTQSTDFARAAALLNAAQFMTQDMNCGEDAGSGADGGSCSAFAGEAGNCKIAVGGVVDCCQKPSGVSISDYLTLIMAAPKLDAAIMKMSESSAIRGAYQTLREPVMSGWTEVTKPFASHIENVSGAVKSVGNIQTQAIEGVKKGVENVLKDVFSASGVEGGAAGEAAGKLVGQMSNVLGTIMTVYTVYVIAVMVIQIIYKCEKREFEMNAKRVLKNCTYVGSYCKKKLLGGACIEKRKSYCCFNSPLSRIIQEQVRPQLGMNFGRPKRPQCGGIPLDRLAEVDWDRVDLDEWLGILQQNGQFPEPEAMTMDSITGAGSVFNTDGTRMDAATRTLERLEGINADAKRTEAMRQLEREIDRDGS